jgi:hypothetical protein
LKPRRAARRYLRVRGAARADSRRASYFIYRYKIERDCGTSALCNDKEREWLLKNQHEITRAEALAAEITSHTQRKTDRVKAKASHHELSGSARAGRRVAIQQLGAELTHAAIGTCVPTSCAPRCCVYFLSGVPGRATARGGASGVLLLPLLRLLPTTGRVRWHVTGPNNGSKRRY